jgi:glycerate kinase
VLSAVLGGEWGTARVSDPLGRPVSARFLLLSSGLAGVEAAEAIGLDRLAPDELDPLNASSRGLGELILAALISTRPAALLVCLGGVATVDGGAGLRAVIGNTLGAQRIIAACDVQNPLFGARGAARAFGPQKGATPEVVEELELRLQAMPELRQVADMPGAGAAGGLGAMLAALGAELMPGAELVLELIGFRDQAARSDLVITGEGTVDLSSREGKAPGRVAAICAELGTRCVVFGGRVDLPLPGAEMRALTGRPEFAAEDLVELGESLAIELAPGRA